MQVGLIGLGKMGLNLGKNLMDHKHEVVAFDLNASAVEEMKEYGATGTSSLNELVQSLQSPRVLWVMVPHAVVDSVIDEVTPLLSKGDILIEAGNSHYKESIRRYEQLKKDGIHFMDAGTSGGMEGARNGACYMIGGDQEAWDIVEPIFRDTAVENGYLYAGKAGSGHFLKMVHNGIEYGMMAAIGEGFEILEKSEFDYDYEKVSRVWNNGSVIRSWLMELTENAFSKDAKLDEIKGVMHSSGEGKWTVETALDLQTATPVIAMSLLMRYRSLDNDTFTGKVVAALRNEFGGHAVEKK
ncbi:MULTISPECIES: phosphogluconate dehydrogenase (NAD(+)-dependent, decarboxylating) [Bacillus]|jgi:6-phosphogluconate dehydrogenase|uniref:6-phosphogluconate dehydrogenase, NADP(+)-dependent, decarboxylating n=2 Tax=Bacillus cereus group TaxID=86661 RepID=A0A0K6J980_9BACI|nr:MULTISPECIES: decarboxylating 6-phosphogluconate dehydrogenase [Bacillus]AAS42318.1 6-phosphogluconate dehydrogenase family protein [Bacillus cereus ATCC 10987]AFQ11541.1 6-phosphogluconate dehydrogenase-like protein [Bacillus cereus FRI-35]OTY59495.1 6-phosphogluconate dehydrogenase (decarboxylating) [Bacillus thuringiensis serovar graciosensis]PFD88338.1 6-phosphogluconate dehydrogenase (decarboxylating) [Bacillus anthracis]AXY09051.1 6-phosphogluconate dehydrogenase (decarboxylating) [Ba